jgi:predicted glycosyltransferase
MKKFLFYIGHPAHYHNVKWVSKMLQDKGHEVLWVVREKDVLFELVEDVKEQYHITFIKESAPKNKLDRVKRIAKREGIMFKLMRKQKPDLAIGTDLVIAHVGNLLGIPSIIINEDDAEAVPLFAKYGLKYCSTNLAPDTCSAGAFEHKTIHYPGYQELAYLHPNYFTPEKEKIEHLFGDAFQYFILRFSSLNAHHDHGVEGINDQRALELIELLQPYGKVWITSERELSKKLEPYRIQIPAKEMHHALNYASMYIGDSQTMAAEAAVLGTPSLRFNDFVGKLGYLEELEHKYHLTYGFPTDQFDALKQKVEELLDIKSLTSEWEAKKQKMLDESIDVTAFWLNFFEHYPINIEKIKGDKNYFSTFRL